MKQKNVEKGRRSLQEAKSTHKQVCFDITPRSNLLVMRAVCVSAEFISLTKYLRGDFYSFSHPLLTPPRRFSPEVLMEEGFAGVDLKF